MGLPRRFALPALLFGGAAIATEWTVTSYQVIMPTTSVWTEYSYTDTYVFTDTFGLKDGASPTAEPVSTTTVTDSYEDMEIVYVYFDADQVEDADILTTTTYNSDYYDAPYTYYVQPITYTAPTSCSELSDLVYETWAPVDIPEEVADQLSAKTVSTSIYTYVDGDTYTQVTAYLESAVVASVTAATTDFVYSYYLADCINPTASYGGYDGGFDGDDDDDGYNSFWDDCDSYYDGYCALKIYAVVLAAVLPSLFLLGFIENYFWFRRMMIGKFSLRFGTCFWIFLALPILCFTRQCPSRTPDEQQRLREQWKGVGFGKALKLWFRYGFRHRYPVEMLGFHPLYHNPSPTEMAQAPPGAPPGGGYIYYHASGPPPDGQPGWQPGAPPPEGFKAPPGHQSMPAVPPGMVLYYPQYPPQAAYAAPPQPPQQGSPSPVSSPSVAPQPTVSPPPQTEISTPPGNTHELSSQSPETARGTPTQQPTAGPSTSQQQGGS